MPGTTPTPPPPPAQVPRTDPPSRIDWDDPSIPDPGPEPDPDPDEDEDTPPPASAASWYAPAARSTWEGGS